jgi:hypothetical protein
MLFDDTVTLEIGSAVKIALSAVPIAKLPPRFTKFKRQVDDPTPP